MSTNSLNEKETLTQHCQSLKASLMTWPRACLQRHANNKRLKRRNYTGDTSWLNRMTISRSLWKPPSRRPKALWPGSAISHCHHRKKRRCWQTQSWRREWSTHADAIATRARMLARWMQRRGSSLKATKILTYGLWLGNHRRQIGSLSFSFGSLLFQVSIRWHLRQQWPGNCGSPMRQPHFCKGRKMFPSVRASCIFEHLEIQSLHLLEFSDPGSMKSLEIYMDCQMPQWHGAGRWQLVSRLGFKIHSFDRMLFYYPYPFNPPYPCAILVCHVDDFLMTYNQNFPFEELLKSFKWGSHQHAEVGKSFT